MPQLSGSAAATTHYRHAEINLDGVIKHMALTHTGARNLMPLLTASGEPQYIVENVKEAR